MIVEDAHLSQMILLKLNEICSFNRHNFPHHDHLLFLKWSIFKWPQCVPERLLFWSEKFIIEASQVKKQLIAFIAQEEQ